MIKAIQRYFAGIPPMFIDGCIYVLLAVFTFLQTQFGSDEAAKYISPQILFYVKATVGSLSAGLLALKLFRSTGYAEHVAEKKSGLTNFFTSTNNPPPPPKP
jgi:hypothetical protein